MKAYLERIGFSATPTVDRETLEGLQRAHMTAVPFENLDVYRKVAVVTDPARSVTKIVDEGRGGWCFELNGAFAELLTDLGFTVARLGAAVLLGGPTAVIDHLCLEVMLDEPYLVDVGFGESACRPLALNRTGPQDGGNGTYELLASPEGTTLARLEDGVPVPQYRFSRLARPMSDFDGASRRLQDDTSLAWHQRALATRLLDGGPDRVTLAANTLKLHRQGRTTETEVPDEDWSAMAQRWFGLRVAIDRAARTQQ